MKDLIWINGEIIPLSEARVGVEDRGFQFADGVYEVIRLYDGRPYTLDGHLNRLDRSAGELRIDVPLARPKLRGEILRLIAQTGVGEGMIYLQLTRGVSPRNHLFPVPGLVRPTLLFYTRTLPTLAAIGQGPAVKLHTHPDDRWRRCWVKSTALLANVLAKNAAVDAGADEAVFVDEGYVSECSASNLIAVIRGKMVTHPVGPKVLPGITRAELMECARQLDIAVEERPMTIDEAKEADEVFITSTTREISPVSHWDGNPLPGQVHGPVTTRLHRALRERIAVDVGQKG